MYIVHVFELYCMYHLRMFICMNCPVSIECIYVQCIYTLTRIHAKVVWTYVFTRILDTISDIIYTQVHN